MSVHLSVRHKISSYHIYIFLWDLSVIACHHHQLVAVTRLKVQPFVDGQQAAQAVYPEQFLAVGLTPIDGVGYCPIRT